MFINDLFKVNTNLILTNPILTQLEHLEGLFQQVFISRHLISLIIHLNANNLNELVLFTQSSATHPHTGKNEISVHIWSKHTSFLTTNLWATFTIWTLEACFRINRSLVRTFYNKCSHQTKLRSIFDHQSVSDLHNLNTWRVFSDNNFCDESLINSQIWSLNLFICIINKYNQNYV